MKILIMAHDVSPPTDSVRVEAPQVSWNFSVTYLGLRSISAALLRLQWQYASSKALCFQHCVSMVLRCLGPCSRILSVLSCVACSMSHV